MTLLSDFCVHLRTVRLERGLRQTDLARQLGLAPMSVGAWERGQARPTSTNLRRWAALLDVEVPEQLRERAP